MVVCMRSNKTRCTIRRSTFAVVGVNRHVHSMQPVCTRDERLVQLITTFSTHYELLCLLHTLHLSCG